MRTVAIPHDALDLRRMLRTTFRSRCPACGEGRLFAGVFAIRGVCARCGVRFERNSGNWTGPVVLGYGVGSLCAFATGAVLYWGLGVRSGLELWMLAAAFASALLAYRPAKAWWIWLLWATGLVFRDDEEGKAGAEAAAGSQPGSPSASA